MTVTQQDGSSPAYKEMLGTINPTPVVVSDGPLRENIEENETDSPSTEQKKTPAFNRDWRFWMIMLTLVISTLLSSLESTVVITSLPTIVGDLKIGSDYIWITNVYFLTR